VFKRKVSIDPITTALCIPFYRKYKFYPRVPIFNFDDGFLYVYCTDPANTTIRIYKEVDFEKNDFVKIYEDKRDGYMEGISGIVTPENTLLLSELGGKVFYRSEDWRTYEKISVGRAPLTFRYAIKDDELYFGAYAPKYDMRVMKSTDDGKSWTEVADLSAYDDHIHGMAYNPHGDVFLIATGDTNKRLIATRDFTTFEVWTDPLQGGTQYLPVCPISKHHESGYMGEAPFLVGTDAALMSGISYVIADMITPKIERFWTIPHPFPTSRRYPVYPYGHIWDILRDGNFIFALDQNGVLYVSRDGGLSWTFVRLDAGEFRPNLTHDGRFLYIGGYGNLAKISKETLSRLEARTQTYVVLHNNELTADTDAGRALPAFLWKRLRVWFRANAACTCIVRQHPYIFDDGIRKNTDITLTAAGIDDSLVIENCSSLAFRITGFTPPVTVSVIAIAEK